MPRREVPLFKFSSLTKSLGVAVIAEGLFLGGAYYFYRKYKTDPSNLEHSIFKQ